MARIPDNPVTNRLTELYERQRQISSKIVANGQPAKTFDEQMLEYRIKNLEHTVSKLNGRAKHLKEIQAKVDEINVEAYKSDAGTKNDAKSNGIVTQIRSDILRIVENVPKCIQIPLSQAPHLHSWPSVPSSARDQIPSNNGFCEQQCHVLDEIREFCNSQHVQCSNEEISNAINADIMKKEQLIKEIKNLKTAIATSKDTRKQSNTGHHINLTRCVQQLKQYMSAERMRQTFTEALNKLTANLWR